ncbi:MAG TPA: tripartite tricarboxylate transporter substrate binding protein [Burkholderiales bacterium]|nr:tripartite tricarboxylate transporter substrate binding protein [Burkholderiales bacterium]
MLTIRNRFLPVAVLIAAALPVAAALAQSPGYPGRPVRIVVPQSAGGSTDLTARLVAQKLSEALGQTVVVDNRPGAGSIIGTDVVAKAAPDGYTLLVVASSITINPSLHKNLPFDPVRDLAPVTQLSAFPNMLTVHPSFPVKTVRDLIALAKARPGEINYGSSGTGTGTHLSAELFKYMTGVKMVHVPYKGGGPAVIALISGQVQLNFATIPSVLPHVRSGKLRAVAVTTIKRSPAAPQVPTIAESGVPGYDHGPWNGMLAPAKTPQAIIAKLNAEVAKIVHLPETAGVLIHDGAEPVGNKPGEFAAIIKTETAKWAKVIKAAGIRAD